MTTTLAQHEPKQVADEPLNAHVVLLTNYIPPYALPVYAALTAHLRKLTFLLSTPMEPNRKWNAEWGSLDVKLQRTISLQRPWKHPVGFSESMSVHLPLDTFSQLRTLRPDVVVSAQFGIRSLLSTWYARWTRTPLVLYVNLSEHQERSRGRIRHMLRRWLIRRATAIAVNGNSGARYLRSLGAEPRRLFHVPYVALPSLFDRLPLQRAPSETHQLLYAGQLIERKGLLPFVRALAGWAERHPDQSIRFELVGSGPLEAEFARRRFPRICRCTCSANVRTAKWPSATRGPAFWRFQPCPTNGAWSLTRRWPPACRCWAASIARPSRICAPKAKPVGDFVPTRPAKWKRPSIERWPLRQAIWMRCGRMADNSFKR